MLVRNVCCALTDLFSSSILSAPLFFLQSREIQREGGGEVNMEVMKTKRERYRLKQTANNELWLLEDTAKLEIQEKGK